MDDEMETTRLKLEDVNKNLLCGLCDGYLIDATTIIECLHSFCRTCIVTYLKTSKSCPKCETLVHKTRPHLNIRSDKLLQDLVYKIVPGLYKDEMKRRREFYTIHYQDAPKRPSEERGDEMSDRFVFTQEELISLALHYCPNNNNERSFHRIFKTKEEFKTRLERRSKDSIHIRYFQCKAAVCVRHIKKLIRLKYDLPPTYQIDMFYNEESLRDSYSLADVALCYNWRRKSPLKLYFSMYEMTMQKVALGEEVPRLSHSSGLRWQQPPPSPSPPPPPTASSPSPALSLKSENEKILSVGTSTTTTTSLSVPIVSSSPVVSSTPSLSMPSVVESGQPPLSTQPPSDPPLPSTSTACDAQSTHTEETLPPPAKKLKSSSSISTNIVKEKIVKPKVKSRAKHQQPMAATFQQPLLPSAKDNKTLAAAIVPAVTPVQVSFSNVTKSSSGSKKGLLGKRRASSSTPVLIAPAPAKKSTDQNKRNIQQQRQQPVLRMAKILKLGNPTTDAITSSSGSGVQNPAQLNPALSNPNTHNNPSVSFIPISLSTVLPGSSSATLTVARPGAPGACLHPAFMNGYFQSITNSSNTPNNIATGLAPGTIRITPTGIAVPVPAGIPNPHTTVLSPMSPGFTPSNIVANSMTPSSSSSSPGHYQCIAKTMSSLSLMSPPGSRCATSISSMPNPSTILYPPNQLLSTIPSTSALPPLIRAPTVPCSSVTTSLSSTSVSSSSSSTQAVSVSATSSATSPTPAASASPTPAAVPSQQSQTQGTDSSNHQLISSSTSSSLSSSSLSSTSLLTHPTIRTSSNSHNLSVPPNTLANGQLVQVKIEQNQTPSINEASNQISFDTIKTVPDSNKTINSLPELKTPIKHCPPSPPPLVIATAKSTPPPSSAPNTSPSSGGHSRKTCKQKTIADIANTLHQRVSANLQQNQVGTSSPQSQNSNGSNSQNQNVSIGTSNYQPNGNFPNYGGLSISSPNPNNGIQQQPGRPNGFLDIKLSRSHSQQPTFNPASLLLSTSQIMSSNPAFNIKKETEASATPTPPPPPPPSAPAPPSSRPNPPSNLFLGMPTGFYPAMHIRPPPQLFDYRAATNLIQQQQQHLYHQQHPHQHPRLATVNGQQSRLEEPLNLVTRDKDFGLATPPTTSVVRQKLHPVVK